MTSELVCNICRARLEEILERSPAKGALSKKKLSLAFFEYTIDQPGFGPLTNAFFPNRGKFEIPCDSCGREWRWRYYHFHEDQATLMISRKAKKIAPKAKKKTQNRSTFTDADRKREAERRARQNRRFGVQDPVPVIPKPKPQRPLPRRPVPPVKKAVAPKVSELESKPKPAEVLVRNFLPQLFVAQESLGQWADDDDLFWDSVSTLSQVLEKEAVLKSDQILLVLADSKELEIDGLEALDVTGLQGKQLRIFAGELKALSINELANLLAAEESYLIVPRLFRVFQKAPDQGIRVSKPY